MENIFNYRLPIIRSKILKKAKYQKPTEKPFRHFINKTKILQRSFNNVLKFYLAQFNFAILCVSFMGTSLIF